VFTFIKDNHCTNIEMESVSIINIDLGEQVCYAINEQHKLYMWGKRKPAADLIETLDYVEQDPDFHPEQILCCQWATFGIDSSGNVKGWGLNANGLLDIPAGIVGLSLSSYSKKTVVAIGEDKSVIAWGNKGANSWVMNQIPTTFRAKQVKLYDTFCLAVDIHDIISVWGIDDAEVSDVLKGFGVVKTVASVSNGSTIIAQLESGMLASWHNASFTGSTVIPEELQDQVVEFLDGYGEHYVAVLKGKLYCWSYNDDGEFVNISWPETSVNVKSAKLRTVTTEYGDFPIVGIIYTDGKVGIFSGTALIEKRMLLIPSDIAHSDKQKYLSDCTEFLPTLNPACLIKQIATGVGFTLVLKKDNTIVGWGSNAGGVLDCPKILAKYIAAGNQCAAAITMDNTLVTWGISNEGLETVKIKKVVLRCLPGVGIALGMDGRVHVFGPNVEEVAQLRPPEDLLAQDIDCNTVDGLTWVAAINLDRNVVQWGPGALVPDFTAFGVEKWAGLLGLHIGRNSEDLLQDISATFAENNTIPVEARRVAVGFRAAFALTMDGRVEAWGQNTIGELQVVEDHLFYDIRAGESVIGMIREKPYIKRWGPALAETRVMQDLAKGEKVSAGTDFKNAVYIEYNGNHIGAVNNVGDIRLWGPNRFHECSPIPVGLLKPFVKPTNALFGTFIELAANQYYGCGLKANGTVVVWGGKSVNNPASRYANLPPAGLNNVKQICAARGMWFALLNDGRVKYWNVTGASKLIGLDHPEYRYTTISTNDNVALGILEGSGKVVGFGENGYGIKKHILKTGGCKYIYAGPTCGMAVDADDRLVIWGSKYDAGLQAPADLGPVLAAVCSAFLVVAIRLDGTLRSWGTAEVQEIVDACPTGSFKSVSICRGSCIGIRTDNTVVEWGTTLLGDDLGWPPGLKVKACATSGASGFNAVIDMEGLIYVRGGNDIVEQRYPEKSVLIAGGVPGVLLDPVGLFKEKPNSSVRSEARSEPGLVSLVAACSSQLGLVKSDGSVVIWRSEADLHFIPRHLLGVDLFAIGPYNCIARNGVGRYFVWGVQNSISLFPETLDATKIVIGIDSALSLQKDNKLLMWGSTELPSALIGAEFRHIAACGTRFAAISVDGIVHMWGHADQPAKYVAPVGAVSISVGANHYAAILENNDVVCWGVSNEYKQLSVPVGLKAKAVSCGSRFTVALTMDDKLVAWGWPKACTRVPQDVVTEFACGDDFVLAKRVDGGYIIWGQDVKPAPEESFIHPSEILNTINKESFRKPGKLVSQIIMNRRGLKELQLDDKVYDMRLGKERKLTSFLLQNQGNAVVFRHKGVQTGLLKSDIRDDILLEDSTQDVYRKGIFYECKRMAQQTNASGGEFSFSDIYSEPYLQLSLINGRYLIRFSDAERIFKQNQFWIVKDAKYKLPWTSSYWGVVIGQPVSSMLHCQEGSEQPVYMLEPYQFFDDSDDDEEDEEPDYVFVQVIGQEERVKISIGDSKTCLAVKQKYALLKGLAVGQIRLFSGGKVLDDNVNVRGGFVLLASIAEVVGGFFKKVRRTLRPGRMRLF
jgi:alpha-tubulin suppressor-like RCC1 family protein